MTRDHGGVNIELLVAKNVRPPAQESEDRGKRQGREGDVVLFVGFSDDVAASRNVECGQDVDGRCRGGMGEG